MKKSELRQIIREEIQNSQEMWNEGKKKTEFEKIKKRTKKALQTMEAEFEEIDGGGFRVIQRDIMWDVVGAYEFEEISDDEVAAKMLDSDLEVSQQATIPFEKMVGLLERNFYI